MRFVTDMDNRVIISVKAKKTTSSKEKFNEGFIKYIGNDDVRYGIIHKYRYGNFQRYGGSDESDARTGKNGADGIGDVGSLCVGEKTDGIGDVGSLCVGEKT